MKTLKFALIGCGRIAVRHSDLLGQKKIKGASLVAVSDLDESKAQKIASKFNVPFFSNKDEMIEQIDPDVLVVLTESGFHAQNVCELARYGKPIIVEKPMALTFNDCRIMIATCRNYGVKLFVVKQNRFNVPVLKLKEALIKGHFGKLVLLT